MIKMRIDSVGIKPFGDVIERPFGQLDFIYSQKFWDKNKLKIKIKNILNPLAVKTEDGRVKESYHKGRSISLGYTRTF